MSEPDYSTYSMEELLDCQEMIDREKWPERYRSINAAIDAKMSSSPEEKATNKQIRFTKFCYEISGELYWSLSDEFIAFCSSFSRKCRRQLPSAVADEKCQICQGNFVGNKALLGWIVRCEACEVAGRILDYRKYIW